MSKYIIQLISLIFPNIFVYSVGVANSASSTCPKKREQFQDQLSQWGKGKQALNSLLEDEHSKKLELAEKECAERLQMEKKVYTLKEEKMKLEIDHLKVMHKKELAEKDLDIEIKPLQKQILMNKVSNLRELLFFFVFQGVVISFNVFISLQWAIISVE